MFDLSKRNPNIFNLKEMTELFDQKFIYYVNFPSILVQFCVKTRYDGWSCQLGGKYANNYKLQHHPFNKQLNIVGKTLCRKYSAYEESEINLAKILQSIEELITKFHFEFDKAFIQLLYFCNFLIWIFLIDICLQLMLITPQGVKQCQY